MLSLLIGMLKCCQSIQNNKFAISSQYLKKKLGMHFLHGDKHQSFCKPVLLFLMEVVRYVQSTQKRSCSCFCVLLWCKTFRSFMGVQSCSSLLVIHQTWQAKVGKADTYFTCVIAQWITPLIVKGFTAVLSRLSLLVNRIFFLQNVDITSIFSICTDCVILCI